MPISACTKPDSRVRTWSLIALLEARHLESTAFPVVHAESTRIVVTMQTGLLTSMVAITNLFVFIGDVS